MQPHDDDDGSEHAHRHEEGRTEEHSFDELAKGMASDGISRRRVLKLVGAAILGGTLPLLASLGTDDAEARRKGGKGGKGGGGRHKKKKHPDCCGSGCERNPCVGGCCNADDICTPCQHGCCDAFGQCQPGTSDEFCGSNAKSCFFCGHDSKCCRAGEAQCVAWFAIC